MAKFSLRFYGQTDERIIECIDKFKAAIPEITSHEIGPLKVSMNMALPCALSECRQVYLHMPEEIYESMPGRDDLRLLYQSYATSDGAAKAEVRRPGDMAHGI